MFLFKSVLWKFLKAPWIRFTRHFCVFLRWSSDLSRPPSRFLFPELNLTLRTSPSGVLSLTLSVVTTESDTSVTSQIVCRSGSSADRSLPGRRRWTFGGRDRSRTETRRNSYVKEEKRGTGPAGDYGDPTGCRGLRRVVHGFVSSLPKEL